MPWLLSAPHPGMFSPPPPPTGRCSANSPWAFCLIVGINRCTRSIVEYIRNSALQNRPPLPGGCGRSSAQLCPMHEYLYPQRHGAGTLPEPEDRVPGLSSPPKTTAFVTAGCMLTSGASLVTGYGSEGAPFSSTGSLEDIVLLLGKARTS